MSQKKLLIVGHGRAGKDTACEYLAQITGLRNAGTTSKYLAEYVAGKLGLSVEEAYARRHESDAMRMVWYNAGNELREKDPTILIRQALANGEITGGVRDREEVVRARTQGLVDLVVWIENRSVRSDPTVQFGPEDCDLVIPNNGSLEEFYDRLRRFAQFAGLGRLDDRKVWVVAGKNEDHLAVCSNKEDARKCRDELQKTTSVELEVWSEQVDDYVDWKAVQQWRASIRIDSGEAKVTSQVVFLPSNPSYVENECSLYIRAITTLPQEEAVDAVSYVGEEYALAHARRLRELVLEERSRNNA